MSRSNVLPGDEAEQSYTMPCPPRRTSQHHRPASDQSLATVQHDGLSKGGIIETPVKAVVVRVENVSNNDSTSSELERSLKAPAGVGLKAFVSPVTSSPASTGVLAPTNTRRIGSKFCIDLVKGWLSRTDGIKSTSAYISSTVLYKCHSSVTYVLAILVELNSTLSCFYV